MSLADSQKSAMKGLSPSAKLVRRYGAYNDHAVDHVLPEGVHTEYVQAIPDRRQDYGPDQGRDNVSFSAERAGAPDDHRPDCKKLVAVASRGLNDGQPSRFDRRRNACLGIHKSRRC